MNYFVFDTETIPDFVLIRQVLHDFESDENELLEKASEELARNQSGFLPPMFHRMVSWVGLWVDELGKPLSKSAWSGEDEKKGLELILLEFQKDPNFGLVHHNGRGFDVPLLTYRCLKHEFVLPPRFNNKDFKYRFSGVNFDLQDQMSDFGASSWPKLKHLSALIGIEAKQVGEGNLVLEMFRNGDLKRIEDYCEEDVLITYLVWLAYRHTIGLIAPVSFSDLKKRAMDKLFELQSDNITPKKE